MRAKTQMMKKLLLLAMPNRLFKRESKSNNNFCNKISPRKFNKKGILHYSKVNVMEEFFMVKLIN